MILVSMKRPEEIPSFKASQRAGVAAMSAGCLSELLSLSAVFIRDVATHNGYVRHRPRYDADEVIWVDVRGPLRNAAFRGARRMPKTTSSSHKGQHRTGAAVRRTLAAGRLDGQPPRLLLHWSSQRLVHYQPGTKVIHGGRRGSGSYSCVYSTWYACARQDGW